MSNENKAKRRKYGEIEPVAIEKAESAALKSILSRMRNRDDQDMDPQPVIETKEAEETVAVEMEPKAEPMPPTLLTPLTPPTTPTPRTRRTSRTPPTARNKNVTPVSPVRDFTKVANSIVREAIPGGVFKGKSKQLYDVLYTATRGAVVPRRSIRITKERLMKSSSIGSERTFLKNISHLKATGLITVADFGGQHGGNEYTVFTPEELGIPEEALQPTPPTPPTDGQYQPHPLQKVGTLPTLQSEVGGVGSDSLESTNYGNDKTLSFKTYSEKRNFDDDEPFGELNRVLSETHEKLTGKKPSITDLMKWRELGEVLVMELKIAAARTESVSNVPAFFAEHLRRRLFKKDKRELEAELSITKEEKGTLKADISQCGDCKGSGWYYPNGYDGGVVKCKHEKLLS